MDLIQNYIRVHIRLRLITNEVSVNNKYNLEKKQETVQFLHRMKYEYLRKLDLEYLKKLCEVNSFDKDFYQSLVNSKISIMEYDKNINSSKHPLMRVTPTDQVEMLEKFE